MTGVAVIGLGRMGGPIADHVIAAGHEVRVYDVSPPAVAARVARGAVAARSAADAARGARVVCVVVFDDDQAIEAIDGPDGALRTLTPGAVIAVHTTVALHTVQELDRRAGTVGVTVLDAGVSGGEEGAHAGTLVTMVGGPADAVERARPVLAAFSKEVLHAGALGAGMALKLARNATFYAMLAAVHEGMDIASRAGVDLAMLEHTLRATGALDQALTPFVLGGPGPLPADAPPQQRDAMEHLVRLADKDLDAALDLAAVVGADTTVYRAVRSMFARVARLP